MKPATQQITKDSLRAALELQVISVKEPCLNATVERYLCFISMIRETLVTCGAGMFRFRYHSETK